MFVKIGVRIGNEFWKVVFIFIYGIKVKYYINFR